MLERLIINESLLQNFEGDLIICTVCDYFIDNLYNFGEQFTVGAHSIRNLEILIPSTCFGSFSLI